MTAGRVVGRYVILEQPGRTSGAQSLGENDVFDGDRYTAQWSEWLALGDPAVDLAGGVESLLRCEVEKGAVLLVFSLGYLESLLGDFLSAERSVKKAALDLPNSKLFVVLHLDERLAVHRRSLI